VLLCLMVAGGWGDLLCGAPPGEETRGGTAQKAEKSSGEKKEKTAGGKRKKKPTVLFLDPQKKVKVDLVRKAVVILAESNMMDGAIELALCSTVTPNCRSHESSFVTDVLPSLVHAGLQIVGLKPGKCVEYNGQDRIPSGDGLYIYVVWRTKGKTVHARLEDLIYNNLAQEPVEDIKWIFTGSRIYAAPVKGEPGKKKRVYEADMEGTIVATWHCSSTVIDISLPEGSNDEAFSAYRKRMPPVGTPVCFVFSPHLIQEKDLVSFAPAEKTGGPGKEGEKDTAIQAPR